MSVEKKSVKDVTEGSRFNLLALRCGDCSHYKGSPHPAFGKPCSELGVKPYAAAPSCYASNVTVFRKAGPTVFAQLASILSTFTPQQSRILMGLLRSAGSLEKFGYTFLEKVYFRCGEDYLDNYYSGFVLGIGYQGTIAIVGATYFTNTRNPVTAYLLPDSVFSVEAFTRKKKKLTKEGKLYAPRRPRKNVIEDGGYEPPTIETAQETLEQAARSVFKKGRPTIKNGVLEVNSKAKQPKPKVKREEPEEIEDEDLEDDE